MSFSNYLRSCMAFSICYSCNFFYNFKEANCISAYSCLFCMLSVIIKYYSTFVLLSSSYSRILLNYFDFSFSYYLLCSALLSKSLSLEFISSC